MSEKICAYCNEPGATIVIEGKDAHLQCFLKFQEKLARMVYQFRGESYKENPWDETNPNEY